MGLAFSVPQNVKIPPSLANIFKELKNEFPERGYNFKHGDLTKWSTIENIFLLNCALTVKKSKPLSHMKNGKHLQMKLLNILLLIIKNVFSFC